MVLFGRTIYLVSDGRLARFGSLLAIRLAVVFSTLVIRDFLAKNIFLNENILGLALPLLENY